jgi:AAA domain (dynein-related subfamily)
MRPIPAPRIGDSHGILRAVADRERVRLDEFLTSENVDDMFPEGIENALGRMRQFVSYARAAGLLREDRGVVELTEIGKRYIRAADADDLFAVSTPQAEWLRRQLFDKHMTDSIFHGLAIGLSLLSSNPPGTRVATLDFGRALAYLGRAGWDNENTLRIQGERYLVLLRDMELIDDERALTRTGFETKGELTLPVHMSLVDIAGQLHPGGPDAVRADGEAEWEQLQGEAAPPPPEAAPPPPSVEPEPKPTPEPEPAADEEDEWAEVGPGSWVPMEADEEPAAAEEQREGPATVITADSEPAEPAEPDAPAEPAAPAEPPVPAGPATAAIPAVSRAFVEAGAIRAAAEKRGLRLPAAVYANVAAALAGGRHLLLTGAPGAGKTTLALAVAEAAAGAGRAGGAAVVTASTDWNPGTLVVEAGQVGRWLVVDDLDRADLDAALGGLSSFLARVPVVLPGVDGEARAAKDWRLVATAAMVPAGSAALLGRFAVVEVAAPPDAELLAALTAAAEGDEVAAGVAQRLLPLREVRPLGAGVFLAAARHGAARRAVETAGGAPLTRELFTAYVAPLLGDLDPHGEQRVRAFLDAL